MPRYIDADALLENLKKQYGEELGWQCTVNMSDVGMMIEDAPAADVAPRAEVAREIFEEIESLLSANQSGEFRGDSIEWFDYFDLHLAEDIAELKKKYTDATDTNVGHKTEGD